MEMESHSSKVLQNLDKLRQEKSLCDIELEVEGKTFLAHRSVLASSSDYFHCLFTSGMAEQDKTRINIGGVNAAVMEDLLSFLYTGKVCISESNDAVNLVIAGDYVFATQLKEQACKYLTERISVSNCLYFQALSNRYNCTNLNDASMSFIRKNFSSVLKSCEFLEVPFPDVLSWFSDNDVVVKAELEIYNGVIAWVNHRFPQRAVTFSKLFSQVRLDSIPLEDLNQVAATELVNSNDDSKMLMTDVLMYISQTGEDDIPLYKPRKCLDLLEAVFICGGKLSTNNKTSNTALCYIPIEETWHMLPSMHLPRYGHAIAPHENYIYAVGGKHRAGTQAEYYDVDLNSWSQFSVLPSKSWFPSVAVLNGLLYVLGGFKALSFEYVDQVQRYNPQNNSWDLVASLSSGRAKLCAVANGDFLYAIGGKEANQAHVSTVERYDPVQNTWQRMTPMHHERSAPAGASINHLIYILGGLFQVPTTSCEIYNTTSNEWQMIATMQVPRYQAAAAVVANRLYVMGGTRTPLEERRVLEVYDIKDNKWSSNTNVPLACAELSYFQCCVVKLPRLLIASLPNL